LELLDSEPAADPDEDPAEDAPEDSPAAAAPPEVLSFEVLSLEALSLDAASLEPWLSSPPFSESEAGFFAPLSRKSVAYQPVPLS